MPVNKSAPIANESRRVTLMSLAALAGVSHTTISSVLRGRGNISKERRAQILKLATKHGYTPHAAAQVLRSHRSGYLGLILGGENPVQKAESGFEGPALGAFLDACEQGSQKYHIEFYRPRKKPQSPAPVNVSSSAVDGIVVAGFVDARLKSWLGKDCKTPWVSIEEPGPYSFISATDQGLSDAVRHLHARGHRRFAFFGWESPYTIHRLSIEGFRNTCRELGLPEKNARVLLTPETAGSENFSALIAEQAQRVFVKGDNPTAVICQGFDIARVVQLVIAASRFEIPKDISFVAYGPRSIAIQSYPRLSFIEPDYATMLKMAVSTLQRLVGGEKIEPKKVMIPTRFVSFESVAQAPAL